MFYSLAAMPIAYMTQFIFAEKPILSHAHCTLYIVHCTLYNIPSPIRSSLKGQCHEMLTHFWVKLNLPAPHTNSQIRFHEEICPKKASVRGYVETQIFELCNRIFAKTKSSLFCFDQFTRAQIEY